MDILNANQQQREAIMTTEGPVLIIAGPGTGKTYTLVKRIVYLITEKRVKPEEIMVATFTEKAAKELITRITNELLEIGYSININEMYIGTFHSICLRLIKEHLEYTNVKKNYRLLDQFDQQYIIFQNISKFKSIPNYNLVINELTSVWHQASAISKYVNNLNEEIVNSKMLMDDEECEISVIGKILDMYNEIILENNLLDFSTIQIEAYNLLARNPQVLAQIQNQIKYIMVDEYQDTNFIQEQLIFIISGEKNNICVVGDDDQGLYRFRGATIRNILEFPNHFNGKCKQINLTVNYRSEKDIIDFYNKWMQTTAGEDFNFSWDKYRYNKEITPGKEKYSEGITVVKSSGELSQESWHEKIYKFICDLQGSGKLEDLNQIAFLFKSVKSDKAVGLAKYLEEKGINIYSPRSDMFFDRTEIKMVLGALLLCFPQYFKKLRERSFNFIDEKLCLYYEECIEEIGKILDEDKDLAVWLANKMTTHGDMTQNTDYAFAGLFYQLFQFKCFSNFIDIDLSRGISDTRSARNIAIFSGILGKYEYLHNINVFTAENIEKTVERFFNSFLRFLHQGGIEEYQDDSEYAPKGCISFMTIHQSKGMEFPIVVVDSLYDVPRKDGDNLMKKISEKYFRKSSFEPDSQIKYFDFWRVYYTAFSRAQNLLVLSCYEVSSGKKQPSKYFNEVYKRLPDYEVLDLTAFDFAQVKDTNIKESYSFTSHIAIYENCSIQYKFYRELEFTPVRVGATLFGTLVHQTIEDIHRMAIRQEVNKITPDNIRLWLDTNYATISKNQHSYLGEKQIDAAYYQVLRYVERNSNTWDRIQNAEVDISLVKPNYILEGTVDLIRGDNDTVEIVDFKSEKKPDLVSEAEKIERYKKQLEVYAHLIEEKTGQTVSKMHLYYTGEENGVPTISFSKNKTEIASTIATFDEIVEKIQRKEFISKSKDKKLCVNCDMRHLCKENGGI